MTIQHGQSYLNEPKQTVNTEENKLNTLQQKSFAQALQEIAAAVDDEDIFERIQQTT